MNNVTKVITNPSEKPVISCPAVCALRRSRDDVAMPVIITAKANQKKGKTLYTSVSPIINAVRDPNAVRCRLNL